VLDTVSSAGMPIGPGFKPMYAVLSSYPPTQCGIATFSAALCEGMVTAGAEVGVVRVGDPATPPSPRVIAQLDDQRREPSTEAVAALEAADVVIVQHEYGLYPGRDGESVVEILEAVKTPSIVVAHTVLSEPTSHQRNVLEAVAHAADAVVVMTEAGRVGLCTIFDVDPHNVSVIPHGAAVASAGKTRRDSHHPALLTWGLLGPGKGIEWVIDALAMLGDVRPEPQYRVAGDTHPKVVESHGEDYREMLQRRAADAGVAESVRFDPGYRSVGELGDLIRGASVVVLPYDSPDQVTSGVLVDAVAAGRPVVATAFPHAQELLVSGAGLVVPQRDPVALADALRRVLTDDALAESMAAEARRVAPSLSWPAVAARYTALGSALLAPREAIPA
jgi:glycosyltransferase involved in cell wall biosynthesis